MGMSEIGANFEPFSVTSQQHGDAAYLRVSGEIDMATAPVLDERLRTAQNNGYSGIVIDLENVTFMDASGLRSLLRAAERARQSERAFAIVKAPTIVQRVLQITGTAHLLDAESLTLVADREMAD
ncbi:MAG: STAS domain-containing protein [Actinomycetota bacterium]